MIKRRTLDGLTKLVRDICGNFKTALSKEEEENQGKKKGKE